jgi:predicted GNAT family acetyltransferase
MDNLPPIIREEHEGGGAYTLAIEGAHRPAILTWKARGENGDIRLVDHTFTPPEARGQGIALKLVEAIIADAREEGFRIAPQCPYVVHAFGKHPEWEDIRAPLPR